MILNDKLLYHRAYQLLGEPGLPVSCLTGVSLLPAATMPSGVDWKVPSVTLPVWFVAAWNSFPSPL